MIYQADASAYQGGMNTLLLGQTLEAHGNPFIDGPKAMIHRRRGAVLIRDGRIDAVGEADDLRAAHGFN